jgi:hypothetical protein
MATVNRLSFVVPGTLLLALLSAAKAPAQELWRGMEGYLKVVPTKYQNNIEGAGVTNLYNSALVVLTWEYKCTDREHPRAAGTADAAANYANPWEQGQTIEIGRPRAGCSGGVTGAIWADGRELGDAAVLRQVHDCRSVQQEEVHLALEGEILQNQVPQWDPAKSIAALKQHHKEFEEIMYTDDANAVAMRNCRAGEVDGLMLDIEDFQKNASKNPDKYAQQRTLFLQYLKEMEQALGSPTYPTTRTWWRQF